MERFKNVCKGSKTKNNNLLNELKSIQSPFAKQLFQILSSASIHGLLTVHDTISRKDYEPKLPPIDLDSDSDLEDEPHIKLIRIYKSRQVCFFSRY